MVSRFLVSACSPASPSCPAFVSAFSRLHSLPSGERISLLAERVFIPCFVFALFPWLLLCFTGFRVGFLAFALGSV